MSRGVRGSVGTLPLISLETVSALGAVCAKDLLNGLDLTQISPGSLSKLVFDGPSREEDEASCHTCEAMERLGLISP